MESKGKNRVLFVYQNTKNSDEDLALTPYLFLPISKKNDNYKMIGIGFCWFHFAVAVCFSTNVPNGFPTFRKI